MVYTLTYSNIHDSEEKLVGKRASYMARISRGDVSPCLFFCVTSTCFEDFCSENDLDSKISSLFNSDLSENNFWSEVKDLFHNSSFSDNIKKEIRESYDALSISGSDAGNILRSFDARVNVFISSENDEGLEGVYLSIKSFDNVLSAIKSCWFSFIKKQGLINLRNGLKKFSLGVVIEKFVSPDFSVEVEVSSDENNLLISVYKGLPEVSQGIVKDEYVLSLNHLEFVNYELKHQNYSILHQEESGVLLKKRLGKEGSDGKASKHIVSECGRLAKKVFSLLNEEVKVYFIIKKDVPYLFLVDYYKKSVEEPSSDYVEKEQINISKKIDHDYVDNINNDISNNISNDIENFSDESIMSDRNIVNRPPEDSLINENIEEKENSLNGDSDEFIVQDKENIGSFEDDVYSSFFKLIELLEEDINNMYKESFSVSPDSLKDAIYELDSKHGFGFKNKLLRVLEVKSMIMQGEKVDEDIVSSLVGVMEDFLKRDGE